jgi:hypothetical protein
MTTKLTPGKVAMIVGIITAGVATRFLEDSNLLVNGVITLFFAGTFWTAWKIIERIKRLFL